MDRQITVTRGGLRLIIDGRDTVVADWQEALTVIGRVRQNVARVAISFNEGGVRLDYLVNPRTGEYSSAEGTLTPEVYLAEVPWLVHAPMLQPDPLPVADQSAAMVAVQSAIDSIRQPTQVNLSTYSGEVESCQQVLPTNYQPQQPAQNPYQQAQPAEHDSAAVDTMPMEQYRYPDDEIDSAWDSHADEFDDDEPFVYTSDSDPEPDDEPLRVSGIDLPDAPQRRKSKVPTAFIAGAVIFVLMIVGGLVASTFIDDEPEPVAEATVPPLDRPPLQPWTEKFSWTMGVDPTGRVGASPDGRFAALVSKSQALHIVNASSGDSIASMMIPGGIEVGPRGTTIGGKQAIVARSGSSLFVWIDGSEIAEHDLEAVAGAGASVTFTGTEPIVLSKDAVKAFRITGEGLSEIDGIEEGQRPYAVTAAGEVIVGKAGPARVAKLGAEDVELTSPGPEDEAWSVRRWMLVSDRYALLLWSQEKSSASEGTLVMHSVDTGEILAKTTVDDLDEMSAAGVVTNEQGGTFAMPGRTFVVDPDGQQVSVVESDGFTPSAIVGDIVFGKDGTGRAVVRVTESGSIEQIDAAVLVPWATTDTGAGIVVSGGIAYCLQARQEETPTPAVPDDVTDESED